MKHDDSLLYPTLEQLLEKIPQKYELVLTATRRAKQILREQRLNPVAFSDDDLRRKPLTIALADIVEGRVDKQALMTLDIEFDEVDQEQLDMFPDAEGFALPREDGSPDDLEPEEPESDDDFEDEDDLEDVGDLDLFDLGSDDDDE
jgi:DNA-directed RNA polymerase omega subunit